MLSPGNIQYQTGWTSEYVSGVGAERRMEWCNFEWREEWIFLKVKCCGFHSLQERSTAALSRIQFMPTARKIAAYLARIHVKPI